MLMRKLYNEILKQKKTTRHNKRSNNTVKEFPEVEKYMWVIYLMTSIITEFPHRQPDITCWVHGQAKN